MALENSKQNIVLDLTYPVLQNIRCVQYDTESRIIGITITDNSKLYKILDTYGIIFKQSKPDGTFVERKDACTILSDGTIELLLPEQSTTCPGLSKCQLEIIDNSVIHTLHFNLVVEKSVIGNQDIESQVDSDILTDMNKHLTDYDNPHKMPIASDKELGIIKSGTDITVDSSGNVSVNDNSHNHVISNVDGLQTALDGKAPSSHTHSSYVNQNAFSNVTVGSTTISADTATDTLTLAAGSNITITPDATNDKITISSTNTGTNTDTKNTAGSTNSSSKLFLIGATSQAANPQTYSHDTAYVGTDGCLYSNSSKVVAQTDCVGLTETETDALM